MPFREAQKEARKTYDKPQKKAAKKAPAKSKEKEPASLKYTAQLNCMNALDQAKKVIDLYENHKGILKNSRVKNKKELLDKIQTILKWVDDDLCKDVETDPPFKPTLKKALELYNKKNPTHKMADGSIHTGKKHTKDSKVVKPAPKKAPKKQAKTSAPVCKTKKGKFQKCNPWLEHVREYQDMNGTTWKESIIQAKATYNKSKAKSKAKPAPKSKAKSLFPPSKKDNKKVNKLTDEKLKKYLSEEDAFLDMINKRDGKPAPKTAKECPKGKVLNPVTNRCKKKKRVNEKKRQPSAWDIHLKNVRENNPQVKGKDVMKLAKESYNKSDKKTTNVEEVIEPYRIEDSDEENLYEDDENIYEDERTDLLQDTSFRNLKESNESLADAFESFDNFGNEIESVANSDMMRRDKEDELNRIRDRFTDYNNLLFTNRDNFTAEAFQRKNKAYDYLIETFKLAMSSLKDGEQNLDLEDYGEEQNIERIIQDELAVEQSPLHDPEYEYLPPAEEDYIDDDEELSELYYLPYEREGLLINPLYNSIPSISQKVEIDYPYSELYDNVVEIDNNPFVESNFNRGISIKKNKPVRISELTPEVFDLTTKEGKSKKGVITKPQTQERKVSEVKPKPKRKIPLNLRLYQAFQRLMKKNSPELSRKDIDEIWKSNKEAYIDMLMEIVEQNGGDLFNEEHYFNAFNNIGGMMCGGDLFEDFTGYRAPEKERRLDSLEDWGDSLSDIGKAVATGVFNVGKLFNPFSWF
jgi:hypothetical protein